MKTVRRFIGIIGIGALAAGLLLLPACGKPAPRTMEYLDRGTVAVSVPEGVYLSWRLLGTEKFDTAFSVYRNGEKIAEVADSTNYCDEDGSPQDLYSVLAEGQTESGSRTVSVWKDRALSIPVEAPEGGVGPDGEAYGYTANDAACADLDGDGEYEIILKWDPSNSFDSGEEGRISGNVFIDAYKLSGERLWRMDLGINIPAGAHFTQIAAFDFDQDGKAELAFKTAPGTKDGTGRYVAEASLEEAIRNADNTEDLRHKEDGGESFGRALSGDEYYTVFQGDTGAALDTVYYPHPRGTVEEWGDDRGNRSERYLAAVAFLDGEHPCAVTWRGYYGKTTAAAYRLIDKRLVLEAEFDSSEAGTEYEGQGNHSLSAADVDSDGKDEILCGSLALDDDFFFFLCSGRGHGDAQHLADYDPKNPGMEYFSVHESEPFGMTLYNAKNGKELFHQDGTEDTYRGMMAHTGYTDGYFEMWGAGEFASYGKTRIEAADFTPDSQNFRIFWDGDLLDDLLDGVSEEGECPVRISNRDGLIEILPDGLTNNGTKNNVCLCADLFGDWREEIVVRSDDGRSLLIYTTVIPTEHRLVTLMHDSAYRLQAALQNVGYNQSAHLGYYVSDKPDKRDRRETACRVRTVPPSG